MIFHSGPRLIFYKGTWVSVQDSEWLLPPEGFNFRISAEGGTMFRAKVNMPKLLRINLGEGWIDIEEKKEHGEEE